MKERRGTCGALSVRAGVCAWQHVLSCLFDVRAFCCFGYLLVCFLFIPVCLLLIAGQYVAARLVW
jgi:hypothetical protein